MYDRADARAWARETLRGHIVTTTTPFLPDLSVDEPGLRTNVDQLLALPCVGGVYVNSVFQESPSLSPAERAQVCRIVVDQVAGRAPVVAVAHGSSVDEAVAMARGAQEAGASLVMIWPPTFGYRTPEGVLDYLRRVADAVDLGVCVYASGLAEFGFRLTPGMLRDLARIENLCAVKEASLSLGTYLETLHAVGDTLLVSCPLDEFWVAGRLAAPSYTPDLLLGTSRPLYLETTRATYLTDLRAAVRARDAPAIEASLAQVVRVANRLHTRFLEGGTHNIALAKAVSGLRGLAAGPVRPPMSAPAPAVLADAETVLREANLVA